MTLVFDFEAWVECVWWQREVPKAAARINALIGECLRHPFAGQASPNR